MSAPKMVPERDAILRERKAFADGAEFQEVKHRASHVCRYAFALTIARYEAKGRFPLPQIERPRVALDPWIERLAWRAMGGIIFASEDADREEWTHAITTPVTADRVALWADLLANPTELVSDSGDTA